MEFNTVTKKAQGACGPQIAQTAVQSIGISTGNFGAPLMGPPEYARAVSLIFTKATEQTIILGTPPDHVCSTSILWNSLAHDKRFEQVPMSQAAPGDILIEPGWQKAADGYAGIVVGHGRIVSNSNQGVRDDTSLLELQRQCPNFVVFRYIGFWNYCHSKPLANAYNPDEPRVPAGQTGGGQWTSGDNQRAGSDRNPSKPSFAFGGQSGDQKTGGAKGESNKSHPKQIKSLSVVFDRANNGDQKDIHDHSGGYNYKSGRVYYGTITATYSDGSKASWPVTSGGYRQRGSTTIRDGDDSSTPAGNFSVGTTQGGQHNGFYVKGTGDRKAIMIHDLNGDPGTHGCIGIDSDFGSFADAIRATKQSGNPVPVSVSYNVSDSDAPHGDKGNGKSSPHKPLNPNSAARQAVSPH